MREIAEIFQETWDETSTEETLEETNGVQK
jgi:hypothetical protein